MQIDDSDLATGHGIPIGNGHDGNFLQAEDILKAWVVDQGIVQRKFAGAGIAKDVIQPCGVQEFEKCLDSTHKNTVLICLDSRQLSNLTRPTDWA